MKYVFKILKWGLIIFLCGLVIKVLFALFMLVFFPKPKSSGHRHASISLDFSKEHGLYVSDYEVGGGDKFVSYFIKDVFLEKGWSQEGRDAEIGHEFYRNADMPYQLVVNLDRDKLDFRKLDIAIYSDDEIGFISYGSDIYCALSYEDIKDTLVYYLRPWKMTTNIHDPFEPDTLGTLIFIKQEETSLSN